ncbi:hypothetical protein LTR17_010663 [Elasticomyces elasticus]|nr:hypothetical protein LTR17_010663 [Elasticomyces elasticus]
MGRGGFSIVDDSSIEQAENEDEPGLELDDGASMQEVYGWTQRLRFLTPMGRATNVEASQHPSADEGQGRAGCRCVRFLPFNGTETWRLRLTSFKEVLDCSHYVAVSYCWSACMAEEGPWRDKVFEIVTPHGCRPSRAPYQVIKRAIDYAALRRLPFLWIDQECIDQENETEKQAIVAEMDRIYRRAAEVIAITTATIDDSDFVEALRVMVTSQTTSRSSLAPPPLSRLEEYLAADPWFYRAWTWHENIRAAQVLDFLIPLTRWVMGPVRGQSWLLGDCVLVSQRELGGRPGQKKSALTTGLPEYKLKDFDPAADLSRHRLSAFDALQELAGKGLSIPADRIDILANIASYSIRIDRLATQKLGQNVGTVIFAQALLNGDMSLLLAYRQFLDPSDEADKLLLSVPSHKSLTSMILSSAGIPGLVGLTVRHSSDMCRSRTLPVSVETAGFRVHGQLWTRLHTLDFPSLYSSREELRAESERGNCDEQHCQYIETLQIALRKVLSARPTDAVTVSLALQATLLRAGRPRNYESKVVLEDFAAATAAASNLVSDNPIDARANRLYHHWSDKEHTPCPLRDFLIGARVHIYAPSGMTGLAPQHCILWNEQGLPAPRHLFSATRVLVDGEDSPEHLLLWTISSTTGLMNELLLHDHFPRKVSTRDDDLMSPFVQFVSVGSTFSPSSAANTGQEYLLKFRP